MIRQILLAFLISLLVPVVSPGFQNPCTPADLVLQNGKIVTVDEKTPQVEALAVNGERIVATGTDDEIAKFIGPKTKVIDLQGKLAIPGFIEGHGHFLSFGHSLMSLDLKQARTWDDIVRLVAEAEKNAEPGEWIIGRGWHQSKWKRKPQPNVEGYPTHETLSRLTPQNPVLLFHASGHAGFANQKAMELAGVTPETPDPKGGTILRDETGRPPVGPAGQRGIQQRRLRRL